MKIAWTHEALERLIEIEKFIAKDSPARAALFVEQIMEHAEATLPDNPRVGRTVPEIANPDIRELIFRKYRVVYRLMGGTIEILTVFEGHRLLRVDEIES
jgi:plasmid stabilization system protein ParE